jgi:hypothetical protein
VCEDGCDRDDDAFDDDTDSDRRPFNRLYMSGSS